MAHINKDGYLERRAGTRKGSKRDVWLVKACIFIKFDRKYDGKRVKFKVEILK